eukprot:COSAG03_NODE_1077_length_4878_cov_1.501151_4_plen_75_part_00
MRSASSPSPQCVKRQPAWSLVTLDRLDFRKWVLSARGPAAPAACMVMPLRRWLAREALHWPTPAVCYSVYLLRW